MKRKLKKEILEKMTTLFTAAFGLVAALAWNDAIRAIFRNAFGEQDHIPAMLVYAAFVTILAVIVTFWIGSVSEKLK